MRMTPRVAGFRSEYPTGFELECMAGFVGIRSDTRREREEEGLCFPQMQSSSANTKPGKCVVRGADEARLSVPCK